MILTDLKSYLSKIKTVSIYDLALRFNSDAIIVRDMLGHLIRKGCIRKVTKTSACGIKCSRCNILTTEIYEWVESS